MLAFVFFVEIDLDRCLNSFYHPFSLRAPCPTLFQELVHRAHLDAGFAMADFKTHITVSTITGAIYGYLGYRNGLTWETSLIGAGLCSVSGMLPDLDSDSGIPLREATIFASALVPMLMVDRLQRMGVGHEMMVLLSAGIYLFIRFGVAEIFRRYTVHRGMWHSIPAAASVGMFAFLICASEDITPRIFKTFAIVLGFMSHLVLDEIWSIEFKGGSYRLKSSFGTALKFWSRSRFANFVTYTKVLLLGFLVYNDHGFMERFGGQQNPDVPHTARQLIELIIDKSEGWIKR